MVIILNENHLHLHLDWFMVKTLKLIKDMEGMMKDNTDLGTQSNFIHLAIDPNCLELLIKEGRLSITDFNCLNKLSKQGVWSMFRMLAANKLQQS